MDFPPRGGSNTPITAIRRPRDRSKTDLGPSGAPSADTFAVMNEVLSPRVC